MTDNSEANLNSTGYAAPCRFSTKIMNQTDILTTLRSLVAQLDEEEKLALAAFLSLKSAARVQSLVFQSQRGLLKQAFEISTKFPRSEKLAFAIELLQEQLSQDEEKDELLDSSTYEEELTEGYYFCRSCNRKTMHELQPQVLPHYETASEEEITELELEKNCILTCTSCADREEVAHQEERNL